MFGAGSMYARTQRLEERVAQQDAAIAALCDRLGIDRVAIDPVGGLDAEERALVAAGKPVAAMKHHRDRTGSSLGQAKRAVEDHGRS